jgi:hypothetical protein
MRIRNIGSHAVVGFPTVAGVPVPSLAKVSAPASDNAVTLLLRKGAVLKNQTFRLSGIKNHGLVLYSAIVQSTYQIINLGNHWTSDNRDTGTGIQLLSIDYQNQEILIYDQHCIF